MHDVSTPGRRGGRALLAAGVGEKGRHLLLVVAPPPTPPHPIEVSSCPPSTTHRPSVALDTQRKFLCRWAGWSRHALRSNGRRSGVSSLHQGSGVRVVSLLPLLLKFVLYWNDQSLYFGYLLWDQKPENRTGMHFCFSDGPDS